MDTTMTTSEILDAGMQCLIEKLGPVGTARFISIVLKEEPDYTKWRQEYFGQLDSIVGILPPDASLEKAREERLSKI